jgi:anti-sigma B factor antagonist
MDYTIKSAYNEQEQRLDVTLTGEVDIFNSADLKKALTELLAEREGHLYLHCEKLDYIDSTALGALVAVMKTVKSNNREMHLVNVKPNLMKLFRITSLDQVFVIEEGGGNAAGPDKALATEKEDGDA